MREFDLLKHIYDANAALPGRVVIPPGDDMGAVTVGEVTLLVTVDQVVDGVHVQVDQMPLELIARKAITRNLSDVAAMAAKPIAAVAAGSLPRDFGEDRANTLFDAMRTTAEAYGCPLIGGDVSIWDGGLVLTVTVFAEPAGIDPVLRRGAKVGDGIFVTGELGASFNSGHHLIFEPRLSLARELAADPATRPNCMMDLSDGLAQDLQHLCDAANLAAILDADALPIREQANGDWRHAVGDGEDYELLFTSDRPMPPEVGGVRITRVGTIVEPALLPGGGAGVAIRLPDATILDLNSLGWEHHA